MRKKLMLILIVAIPLSSVLACTCLITLALTAPEEQINLFQPPLSKTSWRTQEP